ncbi:NUDIX domain-containing protein [Streptomyces sp. NPDC050732]|uniref:NUDIX domain-containing protein n=1 Tax=Streptomyces sp. NPDC050732 TaxID=3154632 RepID=UPI003442BFC7
MKGPIPVHEDTDYAAPGHRRIGGQLLIRNDAGHVLLVRPSYKPGWIMPGGDALPDEGAAAAACREARQDTSLTIKVQRLLLVDRIPANPEGAVEGYNFVFDGGVLAADAISEITLPTARPERQPELLDFKFVHPDDLVGHCKPYHGRRVTAALAVLTNALAPQYLEFGRPVSDLEEEHGKRATTELQKP